MVMVLPSWEALGRMKADEVDLAPDDDDAEGVCMYTVLRAVMRALVQAAERTHCLKAPPTQGRLCSPLCWLC